MKPLVKEINSSNRINQILESVERSQRERILGINLKTFWFLISKFAYLNTDIKEKQIYLFQPQTH